MPPIGICGSGLIDACAGLLDSKVLKPSGVLDADDRGLLPPPLMDRLTTIENKEQFILAHAEETGMGQAITVTQSDIRQLQLAKGAIFSGIVMLMHVMDLPERGLAELMLCGGFGNYINIENAKRIRLLPDLPSERITYVGNAALIGSQMALLSETERRRAASLAGPSRACGARHASAVSGDLRRCDLLRAPRFQPRPHSERRARRPGRRRSRPREHRACPCTIRATGRSGLPWGSGRRGDERRSSTAATPPRIQSARKWLRPGAAPWRNQ